MFLAQLRDQVEQGRAEVRLEQRPVAGLADRCDLPGARVEGGLSAEEVTAVTDALGVDADRGALADAAL